MSDRACCDLALAGGALARGEHRRAEQLLAEHRADARGHWLFESLDARLLAARGQPRLALEKLAASTPDHPGFEAPLFEAVLHFQAGDPAASIVALERARALAPEGQVARVSLESARLLVALGRRDLARAAVFEALDRPPDGVRKRLVATRLLLRAGLVWDAATMVTPTLSAAWHWLMRA